MAVPNRTTLCLSVSLILCALASAGAQPPRPAAPTPSAAPAASPQPASQPSPQPSTPSPQASSETAARPAAQVSEDEADLAITANVTASSLRFDAVPNVSVEFPGRPRRETAWEAERTNLPRPVQPGVTYRDVGVRLKIVSVFADIDRIVAEALGEVPPSDDQAQPNAPPPNATPPAGAAARTERAAATRDARPRASASRRARALRRQR